MNAAGILRVGIFTLILSTTLIAETIPFDYWYGRITGADRAALEYLDGRGDLATYYLSFGIGGRGKYEFFSPNHYIYIPNRSSNKLSSTNAGLNWIQKTPFHSRYEFTLLSHLNEKYDYVSNGYNGINDVDEISFKHRFQIWSGDSLEFDPKTSAYVLINGPWYSARDFHVVVDNLILRNDNNRDFNIFRVEPSRTVADTGRTDGSRHQTDIAGSAMIGLGGGWQTDISVNSSRRKEASTRRSRYQWIYDGGAYIDTTDSHYSYTYSVIDKWGGIRVTRLLRPTLWSSLYYQYSHESYDNETISHYEYLGGSYGHIDHRIDLGHSSANVHEVVGSFVWLSRNQTIERQRILDNFARYYGSEREQGTLVIDSRFRWQRRNDNSELRNIDGIENKIVGEYESVERRRGLFLATALGYYLRPNTSVGANLQIERTILERQDLFEPDFRSEQLTILSCWLEYRSYRWRADKRREISWDGVSDIDYLLGPMLRARDLRVRMNATLPGFQNISASESSQLWQLDFGSLNRDWEASVAGAVGLSHNCEIGTALSYRYHRTYSYPFDWSAVFTDESWESTIKWQPMKIARLSCSFKYENQRIDTDDEIIFVPGGGMEWTVSTKIDLVW